MYDLRFNCVSARMYQFTKYSEGYLRSIWTWKAAMVSGKWYNDKNVRKHGVRASSIL